MDLSIVVVNWNTKGLVSRCLDSIYSYLEGAQFEVVVVDNASSDGSADHIRNVYPQVQLIHNEQNVGFSKANNQAIAVTRGRYILLLNSDAFLIDTSLLSLIELMDADPKIGIAGVQLISPNGNAQESYGDLPNLWKESESLIGFDKLRNPGKGREQDCGIVETGWVGGACFLLRREALQDIGLLDESFFMFSEEVDLCYQAHKTGWKVIHAPCIQVIHIGGGSTGVTAERLLRLYRGKLQYFEKNFGKNQRVILHRLIWLSTLSKAFIYTILRGVSANRIQKDTLWRGVLKGIPNL
jgi:GT2 family glycosyltransferase